MTFLKHPKGREDSLIGKGFKVGGKINKAVGSAVEEAATEIMVRPRVLITRSISETELLSQK